MKIIQTFVDLPCSPDRVTYLIENILYFVEIQI